MQLCLQALTSLEIVRAQASSCMADAMCAGAGGGQEAGAPPAAKVSPLSTALASKPYRGCWAHCPPALLDLKACLLTRVTCAEAFGGQGCQGLGCQGHAAAAAE